MNKLDIIVVGGGHAGIEAAFIASKLGMSVALVTLDEKKIGLMSCNPAIGGLAKGQLVREIDALGGAMARIIDLAGIHFKMLNMSKGLAVQSPRAQADRWLYAQVAQKTLKGANVRIVEKRVVDVLLKGDKCVGVLCDDNVRLEAKAVILSAGTFLNGVIHVGEQKLSAGRAGDLPSRGISDKLQAVGFRCGRLKTGTPPRVDIKTIDFSQTEIQPPDYPPRPFSFATEAILQEQINCFITYTNKQTHGILRTGFDRSPMFTGRIKGQGPRYCPSIEDKIDRFAHKDRHQIFLEPEGYHSNEVYVNGFSTSLPADIQEKAIKTIKGLSDVKILRLGYAVEYDFFPPDQLTNTLESKALQGLYLSGQINGTSGYEEAAAQGLMAGINAALKIKGKEPFVLQRSDAYIGVLIDDLINKIHDEPYRMFTSRAEFRLMLRQDNADLRLMKYGIDLGTVSLSARKKLELKKSQISDLLNNSIDRNITPDIFHSVFPASSPIDVSTSVRNLIKRPEVKLYKLLPFVSDGNFSDDAVSDVEYSVKYAGYLARQKTMMERYVKAEGKQIPLEINYLAINALSAESKEKLNQIKPDTLGQASRIAGVSPADISVLMVYIEKYKREAVSRGTKR